MLFTFFSRVSCSAVDRLLCCIEQMQLQRVHDMGVNGKLLQWEHYCWYREGCLKGTRGFARAAKLPK